MINFLREAGPTALPILFLGTTAVALSVVNAATLSLRARALALGTTVTALLLGGLGTITGFQKALRILPELAPDRRWIVQIGLRESLNALVLSLAFALVVAAVLTLAELRSHNAPEPNEDARLATGRA